MSTTEPMIMLAEGTGDKLVVGALLGFMMLGIGGAVLFVMARAFRGWMGGEAPRRDEADEGEKEKDSAP